MSDIFCHLRNLECSCSPTECKAQPPRSPAPVISFSWRDLLAPIIAGGFIAVILGTALAFADEHYRIESKINQEVYAYGKR